LAALRLQQQPATASTDAPSTSTNPQPINQSFFFFLPTKGGVIVMRLTHTVIHGSSVGFCFSAQGSGPDISVFSAVLFSILLMSSV
jgi:hypothetical protein